MDYAVSHWSDHARGELETIIEAHIIGFFNHELTLKSLFQAQYEFVPEEIQLHSNVTPCPSAFCMAVSLNLLHIVETLLKSLSVDQINVLDCRGRTTLHWAVKNAFEPIALLLIQNGADVDGQLRLKSPELVLPRRDLLANFIDPILRYPNFIPEKSGGLFKTSGIRNL